MDMPVHNLQKVHLKDNVSGLVNSLRARGIRATLRIAACTLWCGFIEAIDERRFHSATAGDLPLSALDIQSKNAAHAGPYCTPSPFRIIRKTLESVRALQGGTVSNSTLIDFGCGRGRVLLMASEYGFKQAIGVEFSPQLCREAATITEAYLQARERRSTDILVVNADAADYPIPPQANVFYCFAFDGHLLDLVARNIVESHKSVTRPIWLIYCKALHQEVLLRKGFRSVRELSWCGFPTVIFTL